MNFQRSRTIAIFIIFARLTTYIPIIKRHKKKHVHYPANDRVITVIQTAKRLYVTTQRTQLFVLYIFDRHALISMQSSRISVVTDHSINNRSILTKPTSIKRLHCYIIHTRNPDVVLHLLLYKTSLFQIIPRRVCVCELSSKISRLYNRRRFCA